MVGTQLHKNLNHSRQHIKVYMKAADTNTYAVLLRVASYSGVLYCNTVRLWDVGGVYCNTVRLWDVGGVYCNIVRLWDVGARLLKVHSGLTN